MTKSTWDRNDLEPDRDPNTGSMIPCVLCGMSPQVGGTGFCSPECEAALEQMHSDREALDKSIQSISNLAHSIARAGRVIKMRHAGRPKLRKSKIFNPMKRYTRENPDLKWLIP